MNVEGVTRKPDRKAPDTGYSLYLYGYRGSSGWKRSVTTACRAGASCVASGLSIA